VTALVILFCLVFVFVGCSYAQSPQGSLGGTVSDPRHARIAGATVSGTALASHLTRQAVTDSSSEFQIGWLAPDEYRVIVTAPNFEQSRSQVQVHVASSSVRRIILNSASLGPPVDFTGGPPEATLKQPVIRSRLWIFSALENVYEDASIAYSAASTAEFHPLAEFASDRLIPQVRVMGEATSGGRHVLNTSAIQDLKCST